MKYIKPYQIINESIMNEKHFLVFYEGDGCDSESHSVYYSYLVKANSKEEAIDKYLKGTNSWSTDDIEDFDAIEITNKNYIP